MANLQEKKIISRDQEIIFRNWTDEDFTGKWDKKLYPLKAKKSYYLPFYLAEHIAKHLADREYNKVFNEKLEELKKSTGGQLDRRNLEHRVQNSPEVSRISRQEFLDKCVTFIPTEENVDVVKPKEVIMKEVVLRKDERGQELQERYGDIGVQINKKALDQQEKDQFEKEK